MNEIYGEVEHNDEMPLVPACRTLMRDGQWVAEVPDAIKQRYAAPVPYSEPERKKGEWALPINPPRERKAPAPKPKVSKPKVKAAPKGRRKRANGRGKGYRRRHDITVESILALRAEGLGATQIAKRFNCDSESIHGRLREGCKDPEFARAEAAAKVCPNCGKSKRQERPVCGDCIRGRKPKVACCCIGMIGSYREESPCPQHFKQREESV